MRVDRNRLCEMIPHGDSMCLLESVEAWDEQRIVCTASSHRSADNPLRSMGALAAIHALEYGAQAMAIHGSLSAQEHEGRIQGGYVASVRNGKFHIERLDLLEESLTIEAVRLISYGGHQIYYIKVSAASHPVAEAQITVMNSMGTDL